MARELGLDTTAALSGDDATVVTEWCNRAVRDILIKTHVRVRELDLDLTADTDTYSLDPDVLQILELWSNDGTTDRTMEPLALDDINSRRNYQDSVSGPVRHYSLQGADLLIVYPMPGSGESVFGQYVPKPTEMSAAANDPSTTTYGGIPVEYHDALENYVLWHGARADDHQGSQRGQQYKADYYQRIQEMRVELLRKRGNRRPIAKVGRRSRVRRIPHDNSATYW